MISRNPEHVTAFETLELDFELAPGLAWTEQVVGRFERPDGSVRAVPLFWAGGAVWKARVMAETPGRCRFRLNNRPAVEWMVSPADSGHKNRFLRHGPVGLSANGRHFAHADGTPFFLLADSWWHGTSRRLKEADFDFLVADRRAQGFNAVQMCVGFACDMPPFDPRDANAAGHPWEPDYRRINPEFYDAAERRIFHLLEQGLLPMLVAMWGYHMHSMGEERVRAHWRHFLARYGALPVVLVLCGEATLPWYPFIGKGDAGKNQTAQWTEVMRFVKAANAFGRPLTVHPGPPLWFNDAPYPPLTDMALPDFHLGMGGHGGVEEMPQLLDLLRSMDGLRAKHGKPVLISEALWENMNAGCGPKIQRAQFWHSVLRGAPGHCYGADALWQMNSRARRFGASPLGFTWGNAPWEEAYQWPGSRQVAAGKRILEKFEWWRMEPRRDWLTRIDHENRAPAASAADLGGGKRLFYFGALPQRRVEICGMESGTAYRATYYNPVDGDGHALSDPVLPDGLGCVTPPLPPVNQDWVLLLEPEQRDVRPAKM